MNNSTSVSPLSNFVYETGPNKLQSSEVAGKAWKVDLGDLQLSLSGAFHEACYLIQKEIVTSIRDGLPFITK